ncbi:MAG: hypothetical protein ACLFPB_07940 [Desulfovermiculus sp.]
MGYPISTEFKSRNKLFFLDYFNTQGDNAPDLKAVEFRESLRPCRPMIVDHK